MATVNVGEDEYAIWDRRVPVIRTAVVTAAVGPTTYLWTFTSRPSGSAATLVGDTTPVASFTPDKPGEYVLACTITDDGVQASDSAKVTVRPTVWVRVNGVKRPATLRVKVTPPSVVSSTVEGNV